MEILRSAAISKIVESDFAVTDKPIGSKITWRFSDNPTFLSVFIRIYCPRNLFLLNGVAGPYKITAESGFYNSNLFAL